MTGAEQPDFGRTVADYSRHRAGFPPETLERLAAYGFGLSGARLLDVGTGTGTLARQFALRGCVVSGLDKSPEMLEGARRLDSEAGVEVEYHLGTAEHTGLPDATFDALSAGQCWHWFDRAAAAREARRVLRPSGKIAIVHFDWIPLDANVVAATEDLILRFNPAWAFARGTGLHPDWLGDLAGVGFDGIETFSFDLTVPYTIDSWVGRIRASAGVAAVLGATEVETFSKELTALLERRGETDPIGIPHRVWGVVAGAPRTGDRS